MAYKRKSRIFNIRYKVRTIGVIESMSCATPTHNCRLIMPYNYVIVVFPHVVVIPNLIKHKLDAKMVLYKMLILPHSSIEVLSESVRVLR